MRLFLAIRPVCATSVCVCVCFADHDYHDGNARRGDATPDRTSPENRIAACTDVTDTLIMELQREFQRKREREIS